MTEKRRKQVSSAQKNFRARKRESGGLRLQTWLSAKAAGKLNSLCAELELGQAAVIEMAIAKLEDDQHTEGKATHDHR